MFECQSSSSQRGGKAENASLPPLFTVVKLHGNFSSAQGGGKVATVASPPLIAVVKLHDSFSSA